MSDSDESSTDQKQISHAYSWLVDHGQMNYELLIKLAEDNTSESLERLHELADDNNIAYDTATDPMQLAEEINTALKNDNNAGVE